MGKAPAFQFYANDFMDATSTWEANACGLYVRCLCKQWTHGSIPSDLRILARAIHSDREELESCWPVLSAKFVDQGDGTLKNRKLEEVRERQKEVSDKRSDAGKLGAIAKANANAIADANGQAKHKQRKVKEKEKIEVEGRGEGEGLEHVHTPKVQDIRFEELWAAYGRLGSKPEALRYWSTLHEQDKQAIEAKAPAYIASTPGGAYRKHLQGWINPKNRLWESAIAEQTTPQANGQPTAEQRSANYERILAERYPTG
jgi:uncharacterized protein YdaU (DUF1376 family)